VSSATTTRAVAISLSVKPSSCALLTKRINQAVSGAYSR
jgi:hypothetical protein